MCTGPHPPARLRFSTHATPLLLLTYDYHFDVLVVVVFFVLYVIRTEADRAYICTLAIRNAVQWCFNGGLADYGLLLPIVNERRPEIAIFRRQRKESG